MALNTGKEMGHQGMTLIQMASSFAALGTGQFNYFFLCDIAAGGQG